MAGGPCRPRSSSKIIAPKQGSWGFSERTPKVYTNLSWEVHFFIENGEGIEVLAKPIFVRGVSPFNGRRTLRPLHPKSLRQIGELGFFRTNSGSVYEPHMWEVRFLLGMERGIEVLTEPIFVRAQPFYGSAPRTLLWLACLMPASHHLSFCGFVKRKGAPSERRTRFLASVLCGKN